jgi:hypothetical protein
MSATPLLEARSTKLSNGDGPVGVGVLLLLVVEVIVEDSVEDVDIVEVMDESVDDAAEVLVPSMVVMVVAVTIMLDEVLVDSSEVVLTIEETLVDEPKGAEGAESVELKELLEETLAAEEVDVGREIDTLTVDEAETEVLLLLLLLLPPVEAGTVVMEEVTRTHGFARPLPTRAATRTARPSTNILGARRGAQCVCLESSDKHQVQWPRAPPPSWAPPQI